MANKPEVSNVVYKTKDYDLFKFSKHNRNVLLNNHMINEAKKGIISPIIVNENYVIIDGQHRFKALQEVGGEVEFIIKNGLNEDDIKRLNTNQKGWNLKNFIETQANGGNEDYIKLLGLLEENRSAPKTALMAVVANYASRNSVNTKVKSGTFKVVNYQGVKEYIDFYNSLLNQVNEKQKAPLLEGMFSLYKVKKFNEQRMIKKYKESAITEKPSLEKETVVGVTKKLIDIYNNKLPDSSNNRIKYYFDSEFNLVIDEELKNGWKKP